MKIASVKIIPVVMSKEDPTWRFVSGGASDVRGFLVKLIGDDGCIGFGYTNASASYHGVTQGVVFKRHWRHIPSFW